MENNKLSNSVIILANGEFPNHPIPFKLLEETQLIICCDGAVDKLLKLDKTPDFIIGDMDSISRVTKEMFENKIIEINRQTDNDLSKAIKWSVENGVKEITILGATGIREDHTLGNLSLIQNLKYRIKIQIVTNFGIFTLVQNNQTFESFVGKQVSIIADNPTIKITSRNLKYPLNDTKLKHLHLGTLNESISDNFAIEISQGNILVFQSFIDCD